MGGTGSRLLPLTKVTNKHLLPVGNRVMGDYPVDKLISAGIHDILIVTGTEHVGAVVTYFGSGRDRGCEFTYRVQDKAGGIAEALGLARGFVGADKVCIVLGDNLFEDDLLPHIEAFERQSYGQFGVASVLLKKVPDPNRFGVAEVVGGRIISIEEKPPEPKSDLAITGVYMYDAHVFYIIEQLHPSARGELEISDVNGVYLCEGRLEYRMMQGWWSDAGTFESLARASELVHVSSKKEM